MTYVTVMYCGKYEYFQTEVVYAGQDLLNARAMAIAYQFPESEDKGGDIQFWQDGKLVKTEAIVI